MAVTFDPRTGVVEWSADTDEVTRTQFQTTMLAIAASMALSGQGVASAKPTAGKRGRFWLSTDTGVLELDDGVQWRVVGSRLRAAVAAAAAATDIPLTVQGAPSQSAALQQWLDSAGAAVAALDAAGILTARGVNSGPLVVTGTAAAQRVAVVKAAAGQTADLQQWLTAAAAVVARINPIGGMQLASDLVVGGTARAGDVTSDGDVVAAGQVRAVTARISGAVIAPNLTGSATSAAALNIYLEQTAPQNVQGAGAYEALTALSTAPANCGQVGAWSYTSGQVTIPVTGRYQLSADVQFEANAAGRRYLRARLNGATFVQDITPASGGVDFCHISRPFYATAGQTVAVEVASSAGATVQTVTSSKSTWMAVQYLGSVS